MSLESFSLAVCGVDVPQRSANASNISSLSLPGGRKQAMDAKTVLKSAPQLSHTEAVAAYHALKYKYRSVSLGAVRAEFATNTTFSDVLLVDRISAALGETLFVRYRLSREQQQQLGENPVIALVPASLTWTHGGGGSWMIKKQHIKKLTGPMACLKKTNGGVRKEGVVSMQVSPAWQGMVPGPMEFRIFSSPDGIAIGKQIGGAVRVELRPTAPPQLLAEVESLTPTSVRLLWEPLANSSVNPRTENTNSFMIRAKPLCLETEHECDGQQYSAVWSHHHQKLTQFHCHEIGGLSPGVCYRFEVHTLPKAGPLESEVSSPVASPRAEEALADKASPRSATVEDTSNKTWNVMSNASPYIEVTMPHRPPPCRPGIPHLLRRELGGQLVLQWRSSGDDVSIRTGLDRQGIIEYKLFWDVPPANHTQGETSPEEVVTCCPSPSDAGDEYKSRVVKRVWQCPEACWFHKPSFDVVECCLLAPGAIEGTCHDKVSFSVRAVDLVSGEESLLSDVSEPIPLASAAEVVMRDAEAAQMIGEVAARAGSLRKFLAEVADAGLAESSGVEVDLRRRLYELADATGGTGKFVESLEGLDVEAFSNGARVLRQLQRQGTGGQLSEDKARVWEDIAQLIPEEGKALGLKQLLQTVEVDDLLSVGKHFVDLGLLNSRAMCNDEGHNTQHNTKRLSHLREVLLGQESAACFIAFLAEVACDADDLQLGKDQIRDVAAAVKTISRNPSCSQHTSWHELVHVASLEGGPPVVQPLIEHLNGNCMQLLQAMKLVDIAVPDLIDFLVDARTAGLFMSGVDKELLKEFLAKLSDAGGAADFFRTMHGFNLDALQPALRLARTTGLHKATCMQAVAGGCSRADAWVDLAEAVEKKMGGAHEMLAKSDEFLNPQKANKGEEAAYNILVEKNGGREMVVQLLQKSATAGGVSRVLNILRSTPLDQICAFMELLRRGGSQLHELERLLMLVCDGPGVSRFLKSLESVQDRELICEFLEYAEVFYRHGIISKMNVSSNCDVQGHAIILSRILADFTPAGFLQAFDNIRLSSLAALVPLLVTAGLLRSSKGQQKKGSENEIAATAESVLRWIARAGGGFRFSLLVHPIDARFFPRIVKEVLGTGLYCLSAPALEKVGGWLADMAAASGDLEAFVDLMQGANLIEVICHLHRLSASDLGQKWEGPQTQEQSDVQRALTAAHVLRSGGANSAHPKEIRQQALPEPLGAERLQVAQNILRSLVDLAEGSGQGGVARLARIISRVRTLDRLEKGLDLLDAAKLLKSKRVCPENWDSCEELQELSASFKPWMRIASSIPAFGGPEAFLRHLEAVSFPNFEACLQVLSAAGLTTNQPDDDDDADNDEADYAGDGESPLDRISGWCEVVAIIRAAGGPQPFLESFAGIDMVDFLRTAGMLRKAGLAQSVDFLQDATGFVYADGDRVAESRVRSNMLKDFVDRVLAAGGFHAFWHALRGVDLAKLSGDLHCLSVIRRKLCELVPDEDMWSATHDAVRLEDLLDSAVGARHREEEDLSLMQRQRIAKRFQEVGGIDNFLDRLEKVSLSAVLENHQALQRARIHSSEVIEAVARIGWLVRHEVKHLEGLRAVATTLVQWADTHHSGEEPARLWQALNQQVTWLLVAIEEISTNH
eukprot:TRINITY_DN4077_c0_g1_i2.p1 TRINITY_DN4077_c0_g1~~TRINITY_DN4077_c0_g1_i2.p1  ORF type:complete len:1655 (+),score=285.53 TRINITY_DN4077_c0_g1_i2:51-4967(+)